MLSNCLKLLMSRLRDNQPSLPIEYKSDVIFMKRLLENINKVYSCILRFYKPDKTLQGITLDVRSYLDTMKYTAMLHVEMLNAHLIDQSTQQTTKYSISYLKPVKSPRELV